ncbi:MAG TPA: LacI family DNA-binding transcriptional regulator [Chthoniobacteraceae bacterium]|nr:LacI family DNA-binding transcriptional regulator [Chthoniobacteraceae bacterium]
MSSQPSQSPSPRRLAADQPPRLIDIARKLGVSVQTVSLVLRDKPGISDDMRERVQREVRRVGYRRNRFAAKFFSKSTKTFGIVVPELSNAGIALMIEEIHHYARSIGFDVEIMLTQHDPAQEENALDEMVGMRVDGIILFSCFWDMGVIPSTHYLKTMEKSRIKVPVVNGQLMTGSKVPSISQDLEKGVADAVGYLHEQGHRRLILACPVNEANDRTGSYLARVDGFKAACAALKLPLHRHSIVTAIKADSGEIPFNLSRPLVSNLRETCHTLVEKILKLKSLPTAIICANDIVAIHLTRGLQRHGLKVPGDLAIVGCDGTLIAELAPVPLTTITFDFKSQAQQLVSELFRLKHPGYEAPLVRKIPPRLVLRESA